MKKKFIVTLTEEGFGYLVNIINNGKGPAYKIKHAHILLNADAELYDYEYIRNGTAEILMFAEPLAGFRSVNVHEDKKGTGWACEIRELPERHRPHAEKIILACDDYSTHKIGSLYETFQPEEARNMARRLETHQTPKHGSWLNMAEIEPSALTRQCLTRRISHIGTLRSEIAAWEPDRNINCKNADWQSEAEDARIKPKRLYPQF